MRTPWGIADSCEEIADGIVSVSTPSHGGMFCAPEVNSRIPDALRNDDGWYEEDIEVSFVVAAFPDLFNSRQVLAATDAIRNWYPDRYEAWTGIAPTAENSFKAAEAEFAEANRDNFVGVAAYGSWHDDVPDGFVGVVATRGGDRSGTGVPFLVPADEYANRGQHGFVIDETRHVRAQNGF